MSKIFDISNKRVPGGWQASDLMNVSPSDEKSGKRLFLFMTGGTGASVIEPLLYYFDRFIYKAGYSVIPVFIDRHFHSEIVSRSLTSIKNYQMYCALTDSPMVTHNPYLFVDDDSLFDGKNNLQLILNKITTDDTVAFACSVGSKSENVKVRQRIMEMLPVSDVRTFNLVFLPYFNFHFGDNEFLNSKADKGSGEFLNIEDYARRHLACSNPARPHEHFFYVGLPEPSRYTKSEYQQNPFNVVSLVQSYALAAFLPKPLENGSFYAFSINIKPVYTLDDIIPDSGLRQTVIKYDFKAICWKIICQSGALQGEISSEAQEQITMYFEEASRLIRQLQDKTIHRNFNLALRKNDDFDHIWERLVKSDYGIVKRKYNKASFLRELLSYTDIDDMMTPEMKIHEILQSVNWFIEEHWSEIDKLYF